MKPRTAISHHRSERGNVLILTAVTLVVVLGMAALAIDVGYLFNGKAELQNALDSAALAAVTQTHVVIPLDPLHFTKSQYDQKQIALIKQYAESFAEANEVRRTSGSDNKVDLNPGTDIELQYRADPLPRIIVNNQVTLPTFFAGVLGFNGIDVSAKAESRLVAVDGGTGTISGGAVGGNGKDSYDDVVTGCWRPLLIPDSYFDASGNARRLSIEIINGQAQIREPEDHSWYRSRFVGKTEIYPFVDLWQRDYPATPGTPPPCSPESNCITSLRDASSYYSNDSSNNFMGLRIDLSGNLTDKPDYRIVDFDGTNDLIDAANRSYYGYCGQVRVGTLVRVFPMSVQKSEVENPVYHRLRDLRVQAAAAKVDTDQLEQFGYVAAESGYRFQTPNVHPLIIPVLLCNPFEFYRRYKGYISDGTPVTPITVTNIGVLFIDSAGLDGDIKGRFVREVMTGGTAVDLQSINTDNVRLLPVSARLVRQ